MHVLINCVAFGLGTWQVYRLQWKQDLIDARNESKKADPVALSDDILSRTEDPNLECAAIQAEGKFQLEKEFLLGPRSMNGVTGCYVITPFQTKEYSH
jgi:surfeit locus 1 family protein